MFGLRTGKAVVVSIFEFICKPPFCTHSAPAGQGSVWLSYTSVAAERWICLLLPWITRLCELGIGINSTVPCGAVPYLWAAKHRRSRSRLPEVEGWGASAPALPGQGQPRRLLRAMPSCILISPRLQMPQPPWATCAQRWATLTGKQRSSLLWLLPHPVTGPLSEEPSPFPHALGCMGKVPRAFSRQKSPRVLATTSIRPHLLVCLPTCRDGNEKHG